MPTDSVTELREAIDDYKAFLETGERCTRSLYKDPGDGGSWVSATATVECVCIRGVHATQRLRALETRLAQAKLAALNSPELLPALDAFPGGCYPIPMIDFTVNAPGTVSPTGHATAGESWPSSWYVRADVLDALDRALARLPVERTPALSAHAAAVYEILLEQPTYRSMTGPELIKALENRNIFTEQSTLTSRIVPELKPYGVENKPRIGYRIPEEKRPSR